MRRWTVEDRQGRAIYMTEERWQHITSKHRELQGRLDDILLTIRQGRRKQSRFDPQTYVYSRKVANLPPPYNTILVYVAFRYQYDSDANEQFANNYVTTAWGETLS